MTAQRKATGSSLRRWLRQHRQAAALGWQRLVERPFGNGLTIAVLAVAFALPAAVALVLKQAEQLGGSLSESREIALFLAPSLGAGDAERWATRLRDDHAVATVAVRDPEQGLAELAGMRELDDALALLEHNPLPWVLVVEPAPGADDHALAERLRQEEEVDFVQHDAAWRARLDAWLTLGRRIAVLLGLGLVAAGLLIIGNTVRLELRARAEEIAVLRLLGADDAYVRRPFLYLGAAYGLLAALLAVGLNLLGMHALDSAVAGVSAAYGADFVLTGFPIAQVLPAVVAACVLGMVGAALAVGHHLRQSEVA